MLVSDWLKPDINSFKYSNKVSTSCIMLSMNLVKTVKTLKNT